ncbi:hypothetical protein [Occallatibacter savannae]|uniref:hypothetical protein n=1 Tax=Occallatibacter savannae TaxID=1002691 RepID=UPI000D68E139|nr:hypothetical protein [Occallatibacter savannae]
MSQDKARIGPKSGSQEEQIRTSILDSYKPSDGCPPLKDHWGGYSLAAIPWLPAFAEQVAGDKNRRDAWKSLTERCDSSYLIDLVYVFTRKSGVLADDDQEDASAIKEALDHVLKRYEDLEKEIRKVVHNDDFRSEVLNRELEFQRQFRFLDASCKHMRKLRDYFARRGLRKRDPRDWYLMLLCKHTMEATGSIHEEEIVTLIEAAYDAHQHTRRAVTTEVVVRQLRRAVKHYGAEIFDGRVYFRFQEIIPSELDPPRESEIDDSDFPF